MRLTELNPKLSSDSVLVFDCPCGTGHALRVDVGPEQTERDGKKVWAMSGQFPELLTLAPSLDAGCWRGHVTNGEITP